MSSETNNKEVIEAALMLPRRLRALLAEKLIHSLDYDDHFDISPEWENEIKARCRDIDEKKVKLIPAEDVFCEIDNSPRLNEGIQGIGVNRKFAFLGAVP
jgi:putative addiction module component (TIGR02574 family)